MPLIVAEPRAAYGRRPRLVVDASVLAAALFAESDMDHALAWMGGRALCAPQLIEYELANVALNKVRRRMASQAAVATALEALDTLDLERHGIAPRAVFALAARYGLSAYDAAYLWLAEELGAPLATFDAKLGTVAQQHLGGQSD